MAVHCGAPAVPGEPELVRHPEAEQETETTAADRAGDRGESQMHSVTANHFVSDTLIHESNLVNQTEFEKNE